MSWSLCLGRHRRLRGVERCGRGVRVIGWWEGVLQMGGCGGWSGGLGSGGGLVGWLLGRVLGFPGRADGMWGRFLGKRFVFGRLKGWMAWDR